MSNAAKLKKRAVELEQKKQFDKALPLYIQFLQESEGVLDDGDVPLYNRVGDLMLRTGNAADALNYYEKAVDLYAERGFLNNAIALCNKVLRQSPGRASIYYKLGKISATKGFKSDAKKNFLEYADRMQKAGQIDEAFRALKEFADLCPDQDDIRLMLAEQLTKENRQDEALEQLQKLHDKLDSEGRTAEVRATVDRMKSIDPDAVPRVSGSYVPQKSSNLIFLDTSFEQASRAPQPSAPPPRAPTPAGRPVSDPDLVVLTLGDQPDAPVSPMNPAAVADAFAIDLDVPNGDTSPAVALPLLDIGEVDASPSDAAFEEQVVLASDAAAIVALDLPDSRDAVFGMPPEPEAAAATDSSALLAQDAFVIDAQADPAPVDLVLDQPSYVSGPPLGVDYVSDLHTAADAPAETSIDDLFDFRAPPRADGDFEAETPSINLDPDVAFPSFDLDDMSLPSADEITSGASLAAALSDDDTLGSGFGDLDLASVSGATGDVSLDTVGGLEIGESLDEAAASVASDSEWTMSAATASVSATPQLIDAFVIDDVASDANTPPAEIEVSAVGDSVPEIAGYTHEMAMLDAEIPDDRRIGADTLDLEVEIPAGDIVDATPAVAALEPATETAPSDAREAGDTDSPEFGSLTIAAATPVVAEPSTATPTSIAVEMRAPADPTAPETERRAGWELQRAHAEQLLEAGDRAAGVQALEQVAVDLERIGDLERALTIVDELIRLTPDSVRHHQKRVELAFRSNDRAKLIDAYIELGDALFRSGEEKKARAVYQRVLELAPDDARARAAVDSVSWMSPPMGSGAIPAVGHTPPSVEPRVPSPPARPHPRDIRVPYQSGPATGGRGGGGIAPPTPARKPSPLDRSAASNGEFVDLGDWFRSGESPKSTRMVAEEKPPTGDEQADFQEMLKRFKQGVAENVDDEDYESHYDLGIAYKEMGLMDEAVAEFQKALRGNTHRVRTYEALGQCFVEKEQYQVAASVLSRAIALGEGDDHHLVGVLYLLGRATEALSKHGDALDYYQRVFAVDIEFRDVADRIGAIQGKAT
jgi:tetratricopeptide (TPR) repeat protein